MTYSFHDTQNFYKKMLELQEKLRKSEDERMKLETKFNLLSQDSRNRREACINKLRMRYIDFLEEQRLRDERNHQILGALDKIDGSLARMTARTDRLGILRKQYEAYLLRLYANRNASGGTGDSGVGSHNDDKSAKVAVSQTEKERPSMQRIITQSAGSLPNYIPQTNYPQSHIGASNISDFNIARHTPGQEILPQVNVTRIHGQGDGPTTHAQPPHPTQELFYGSQIHSTAPNLDQEYLSQTGENYPARFPQSSRYPFTQNSAQIQRHQLSDIADPRSRYAVDQSMMRLQNPANNTRQTLGHEQFDLQKSIGPQSNRMKTLPTNFSTDFNNQNLGPYRQSTPLPGYLDYSTRYSRDSLGQETNDARRSGLTRIDLENVIHRNEDILPRDYLHNTDTLRPLQQTSKLVSSIVEDKRRVSEPKPPNRDMSGDELDEYINRIRSLHRDNDQSLMEALDIEQNTSGDLLNATLSDDGFEPLPHQHPSGSNKTIKTVPEDIRNILELADDFLAETAEKFSEVRDVSENSDDLRQRIDEEGSANNPKLIANKPNDVSPATLASDMTLDSLSISATRDDILSGTTSLDPREENQDKSAISSDNFKPAEVVVLPIADLDTPHLNIKGVAKLSKNNVVDPTGELPPDENDRNRVLKSSPSVQYSEITEKLFDHEKREFVDASVKSTRDTRTRKDPDSVILDPEVHEDIEGDKVCLIEEEQPIEKVIDVVRELKPPSLQHYEKNVVEICVADDDKKDIKTRKATTEGSVGDRNSEVEIQKTGTDALDGNNAAEFQISSRSSDGDKITAEPDTSKQEYSNDEKMEDQTPKDVRENAKEENLQYSGETGAKYEGELQGGYPDDKHRPEEQFSQNSEENRDTGRGYDQMQLEQPYNPDTNETSDYELKQTGDGNNSFQQHYTAESNEPYDSNQIYDAHQEYEANPDHQYAYEGNEHTEGDPNGQYADDQNERYVAKPNEQYAVDPNNQYAVDPNNQYAVDPTDHYAGDSNQHYVTDPNEQYIADANEEYGYYQNDPNVTYKDSGNEKYEYSGDQNYQQDPNQQYEHDPNQQYENDPNQQYENDPNQQYEHDPYQGYEDDPNQSYPQDPNHGYKDYEYEENVSYAPVDYGEAKPDVNQELKNETNQNDPMLVAGEEQNEFAAEQNDLYDQAFLNPEETKAEEYSAELGRKKDKDVIKALLESDTESMIERNPSNNTESDFDFN